MNDPTTTTAIDASPTKQQHAEEEADEHSNAYVDPSGHFVTDDFLEKLLQSRYLNSKVAREQVDELREQVRVKKEAEEQARLAREEGAGSNGVQLLRSNTELDGAIQTFFSTQHFLLAKTGVVRRAMLSIATHLGCERENTLLVRSTCPEDNVDVFRGTDWLTFAGPRGYNLGGLGGLPSGGLRGMMAAGKHIIYSRPMFAKADCH
jgi:hypothetical protein